MVQPISFEALQVLDAIDRKGSFAAAANALYRVPSAITYSVQKLEEDLGVALFKKEGRRSVLTPAGKVLLARGREILEAVDRLAETTRQVDSGWESRLNIAVDSIVDFAEVYPLIEEFYQLKPDIEINLYEEVLGGAWESIAEGRADLVIGAAESQTSVQGMRSQLLQQVHWKFVVSPNHPLAGETGIVSQQQIERHRGVVVRDSSRNTAPLTMRVFARQPVLSVPTLGEKIRAQMLGLGTGYLPLHRIEEQLANGELVEVRMESSPETTPVFSAWKSNNNGRALQWFIRRLENL